MRISTHLEMIVRRGTPYIDFNFYSTGLYINNVDVFNPPKCLKILMRVCFNLDEGRKHHYGTIEFFKRT